MSAIGTFVRRGSFDVVVLAAPAVRHWPTVGVKRLSLLCSDAGLSVGQFGGPYLGVKGVVPSPRTGGWVWVEDAQRRVHRIHARAVVRMSPLPEFPDPFAGWRSEGLIPITTAEALLEKAQTRWAPGVAFLGTGNRALRMASRLLEQGIPEVSCIESHHQWGAKRFAGWEVERRRFQMLGGKMIEAYPHALVRRGPLLWEFQLKDQHGIRLLEVSSVISAGPFLPTEGIREYPPGSLLFDFEQTADDLPEKNIEGWFLEEERARLLGGKIIRQLSVETTESRESSERTLKKARIRLKRYHRHFENPFLPEYQGKWLSRADLKRVREFPGVPKTEVVNRLVASIECFEEIACNLCETACPESAIDFSREGKFLNEAACTACGACLPACPSRATLLLQAPPEAGKTLVVFPLAAREEPRVGELVTLLNRRGEGLGSGRVAGYQEAAEPKPGRLIRIEIPAHLAWEARGYRRIRADSEAQDEVLLLSRELSRDPHGGKIEVQLEGEKRFLREGVSVALALYETGRARAGDALLCPDGSCGLCAVMVDGTKKLACQTKTHARMAIRARPPKSSRPDHGVDNDLLCPCLGLTSEEARRRIRSGNLLSPEAALRSVPCGEGRCHGQVCGEGFRRLMIEEGIEAQDWIDWRFPWTEWKFRPGEAE